MIKNAWPYQKDKMNLPVANVETAISFYEKIMGFKLIHDRKPPYPSAILERDEVQFGLSQNGGDPTQDGCFFEVDKEESELLRNSKLMGWKKKSPVSICKHTEKQSGKSFSSSHPTDFVTASAKKYRILVLRSFCSNELFNNFRRERFTHKRQKQLILKHI